MTRPNKALRCRGNLHRRTAAHKTTSVVEQTRKIEIARRPDIRERSMRPNRPIIHPRLGSSSAVLVDRVLRGVPLAVGPELPLPCLFADDNTRRVPDWRSSYSCWSIGFQLIKDSEDASPVSAGTTLCLRRSVAKRCSFSTYIFTTSLTDSVGTHCQTKSLERRCGEFFRCRMSPPQISQDSILSRVHCVINFRNKSQSFF